MLKERNPFCASLPAPPSAVPMTKHATHHRAGSGDEGGDTTYCTYIELLISEEFELSKALGEFRVRSSIESK